MVDNVFCSGAIYQQISVGCEFKSRGRAEVIYGHPNLWAYVAMRTSMDHGITRAADWSDRALACIRWLDMVSRCLQLPPLSCYAYPVVSVQDRCCQSRAPCLLSRLEGKKSKSKKQSGASTATTVRQLGTPHPHPHLLSFSTIIHTLFLSDIGDTTRLPRDFGIDRHQAFDLPLAPIKPRHG